MSDVKNSEFDYIKNRIQKMKIDQLREIKRLIDCHFSSPVTERSLLSDEEVDFLATVLKVSGRN